MTSPVRVLVTGSRDWTDRERIESELTALYRQLLGFSMVVVHGACPTGADKMASDWVNKQIRSGQRGVREEPHPANWGLYGKSAGPRRNQAMVDRGANFCLAFIRDGSAGATGCAEAARVAGVQVKRITDPTPSVRTNLPSRGSKPKGISRVVRESPADGSWNDTVEQ